MWRTRTYRGLLMIVLMFVLEQCSPSFQPPSPTLGHILSIQKISYSPKTIRIGEKAQLTAIAIDPDNDALVFYWSAQYGLVPGGAQGSTVDYIAPRTSGIETIEVTVTDGAYVDTKQVRIAVLDALPPATVALAPTVSGVRPTLPAPSNTPTATPVPTDTPTPAPTLVPATPVPASTEAPHAVAHQAAGIFAAPNSTASLIGSIQPGYSVTIIGRASVGSWFYLQTDEGVRGFAYQPLFDWNGDFQSLPVVAAPTLVAPPTSVPLVVNTPSSDFIGIDFYPIPDEVNGHCAPVPGYTLQISGLGELSPFEYYIDGVLVYKGSGVFGYEYRYPGQQPNVQVIGTVKARDGRSVEQRLFLRRPNC